MILRLLEMSTANLESKLEELFAQVKALNDRWEKPLPSVLTKRMAAKELSISVSKLKGMIARGLIMECEVGDSMGIPSSEIRRIAESARSSAPKPRTSGGRPKAKKYNARAEAADLKEELRRRIREGR